MTRKPALKYLLYLFITSYLSVGISPDNSYAQFTPFSKEVHKIDQVEIVSTRNEFYGEDQKKTNIDTSILQSNSSGNLDELLTHATPVFIKNYGSAGSLAVPSLRGSTSNHISLTWNGFPINSITLGQCDLSNAPVEFMDKITITHGASGSLYGSGTFGGNIDLKNEVNWNKNSNASFTTEYGSWDNQRHNIQSLLGNKSFKYRINGFYQEAANDFKYHDTQKFGTPLEEREHNRLKNYGLMQNVFYKFNPRSKVEAGIWYQKKEKQIPALMGEYGSGTNFQKDSVFRAYIQWNKTFTKSSLQIKTGFFSKYQLYTEKENPEDMEFSIYSPISTKKWLNDANYRYYYSDHITFDLGTQYSRLTADVGAYNDTVTEYRGSIIGAMKINYPGFVINLSLRQQFNNYLKPKPQVSLGMQYALLPKVLYIRGNYSTKYRIPTFNDKHWNPGGNKDIRPEHGWSGEFGLQFIKKQHSTEKFSAELTGYTSKIKDLIQWVPKDGESYWHAINTAKVQTMGVESSVHLIENLNPFKLNVKLIYNYTNSVKRTDNPELNNKQLRYTPYHNIKNVAFLDYKRYTMGITSQYTGKRFTTADNSVELPGYFTSDVFLSRRIQYKRFAGDLKLSVKNLFDKEYQVIANYPMPGRAYFIKLNVKIQNLFKN